MTCADEASLIDRTSHKASDHDARATQTRVDGSLQRRQTQKPSTTEALSTPRRPLDVLLAQNPLSLSAQPSTQTLVT